VSRVGRLEKPAVDQPDPHRAKKLLVTTGQDDSGCAGARGHRVIDEIEVVAVVALIVRRQGVPSPACDTPG